MSELQYYRAIFISDVHLGTVECQADYLLDFLNSTRCGTLYLVGDIIDLIGMQKRTHFPPIHRKIIDTFMQKAREGTRVVYIPGNHDEFFRTFCGQRIAGIELRRQVVHVTADQRRFMVAHGDDFDQVVRCSPLLLFVGDRMHDFLLSINRWFNFIRKTLRLPYWSLATFIKGRIGKAQAFIGRFEQAAITSAGRNQYDGYICGHIHFAGFRASEGVLYCNDGDWVEHCTALVERDNGQLEIVHWSEQPKVLHREPVMPVRPVVAPVAA